MSRLHFCLILLCFPCTLTAQDYCGVVLKVEEVIRIAPKLQGKIRCVQGVIALSTEATGLSSEILALDPVQAGHRFAQAIGLIDGNIQAHPNSKLYKPESFEKIARLAEGDPFLLEVTIRGEISYKKRLMTQVKKMAEGTEVEGFLVGPQRDVELVLLEIVKVHRKMSFRTVTGR